MTRHSSGRSPRRAVDQHRPRGRDLSDPPRGDQGGRRGGPAAGLPRCRARSGRWTRRSIRSSPSRTSRPATGRSWCGTTSPAWTSSASTCDRKGQPFALVQVNRTWSLTVSHEAIEMISDPWGNRVVPGGSPRARPGHRGDAGRGVRPAGRRGPCVHDQRLPRVRLRHPDLLRPRRRRGRPLQLHRGDRAAQEHRARAATWRGGSRRPTSGGRGTGSTSPGRCSGVSGSCRIPPSPCANRSTPSRSTPSSTRAPHPTIRRCWPRRSASRALTPRRRPMHGCSGGRSTC